MAYGRTSRRDSCDPIRVRLRLNGLPTAEAKPKIIDWLEEQGLGQRTVNYKLRDWLFSRQRYWGEPFPILHELTHDGMPPAVEPLSPKNCRCACRNSTTSSRPASPSRRLARRRTGCA